METLITHHDGIDVAYQRFVSLVTLLMGIGADILFCHDDFCAALVAPRNSQAERRPLTSSPLVPFTSSTRSWGLLWP